MVETGTKKVKISKNQRTMLQEAIALANNAKAEFDALSAMASQAQKTAAIAKKMLDNIVATIRMDGEVGNDAGANARIVEENNEAFLEFISVQELRPIAPAQN